MRILVLGGTAWLGRTVVEAALASGHQVTCIVRGRQVPHGARLVNADRDQNDALTRALWSVHDDAGRWDAVVDVATEPGHVRRAVRDLEPHAARYVFISSCNVYASLAATGIDEDEPRHTPLSADEMASPEEYGPAKTAGEDAVRAAFGPDRSVIIRPGLIGGPGDPTGRTAYWPLRFRRPSNPQGRVLVPSAPTQDTAVIDVRDLAAWVIQLIERARGGVFNAAGETVPFARYIETARRVTRHDGPLVRARPEWLAAHGVTQWMGSRSLPLWIDQPDVAGLGSLSNARALAAGLKLRPIDDTLTDTLDWATAHHVDTVIGSGLTDDEEHALLEAHNEP